jgi:hypothetical protein
VGDSTSLVIGQRSPRWNLQRLSPDQIFLAFDTTGLPSGCDLQAVIDNGASGSSQPFTLARILALPQIDSFTVSADPPQNGTRQYEIIGTNLEMIGKLGWDEASAVSVTTLPAPLPGPGLKQSIRITLPDPVAPNARLCTWLRGDQESRLSTIKAPDLPLLPAGMKPSTGAAPVAPVPDGNPADALVRAFISAGISR